MTPLAKLQTIPHWIASVGDYEKAAQPRVSEQAWAYLAGGAGDEWTLRENAAAYDRIALRQRVLQDLSAGHTKVNLLGREFPSPIVLAPVAFQKLVHPQGETATALAASALDVCMTVSTQSSVSLEEIASDASAPLWFQLYFQHDRGFTAELVRRAERAGYMAIVLTADAPATGARYREQRAGFFLPREIEAVNLRGLKPQAPAAGRLLGSALLASAPTWRDIEWLKSLTSLPILLKGVMTPEDARQALRSGLSGVVASNHGGRTLDGQPATIDALPGIVDAVADEIPVLVDGSIRRGSDIYKAVARGAASVMIGRVFMYGLASAGVTGVAHVLQILQAELEIAMALTGCTTLAKARASGLKEAG